jgi:phosphatidylglycerol---prolipoprotein diacylglyceryl transferase
MLMHPQFNPVALDLGPIQIHWYGLTYLVAFGLFMWLAARRIQKPWFQATECPATTSPTQPSC